MAPKRSSQVSKTSPVPWSKLRVLVLILLPLLSVLGAFGVHVQSQKNGTFNRITTSLAAPSPMFPGTTDAMVKTFTGIGRLEFVDKQLQVLVTFFAPVVDPAYPGLNLFSIHGAGQFGAAWTLMMMEGMRMGNRGRIISYVGIFGILIQNAAFTVILPLYLFIHLLTSPIGKFSGLRPANDFLIPSLDMALLPMAVAYGYIIPTLLMLLPPSVVSTHVHQYFIAFWQAFPLWTVIIQSILTSVLKPETETKATGKSIGETYLIGAQGVYGFMICLSAITHIPVILATLLPASILPASTPSYIMQLFRCSFSDVFVPYYPDLSYKVPSLAAGVLNFLQWDVYVGCTAFMLWGIVLCRNAVDGGVSWGRAAWRIVSWVIVSGPMGALAMLLWERDTMIKEKVKET